MADFPRIKWLNVDGQQVPFTEPQHFTGNGDETVRTGKDNPLPVANYTQNENGIWLPVSKDNPMPTQVTGSIVEDWIIAPGDTRITLLVGEEHVFELLDFDAKYFVFNGSTSNSRMGLSILVAYPYIYNNPTSGLGDYEEVLKIEGEGKRDSIYFTQRERTKNNDKNLSVKIKNTGQRTLELTRLNIRGFN